MVKTGLKIGIFGRGPLADDHADRLLAVAGVSCVGSVDAEPGRASSFAAFDILADLIRIGEPDILLIGAPDRSHYRAAMEGLQAGCHLLLVPPLSTSVQESVDIAGLARARNLKVGVAHAFRNRPSLIGARRMLADGAIGRLRLVIGTLFLTAPVAGGVLAGAGIDWIDGLLSMIGGNVESVAATRETGDDGLDLTVAASLRMAGGVLASVAIAGEAHRSGFKFWAVGESGQIVATETSLVLEDERGGSRPVPLDESEANSATNFVEAVLGQAPLGCSVSEALDAVRVLEAIARSAAIGQFVGLA
jgi:predicted dehydrogenase